jgi:GDP-L-fucose synthase
MSETMKTTDRIYVAGHTGLAGGAIARRLRAGGYDQLITRRHHELELLDQAAVGEFFRRERPDVVFLAAAKVGGILANSTLPADFIYQNLMVECNVIHAAYTSGVKKLLFLGSSCIYPRLAPQPMQEECLLSGPLEPTNEAYAVAKIAGIKLCAAYNRQYGTNFLSVMPTNLYGPGDNYDLAGSHVLPALIRKVHEAKRRGDDHVVVWGSGRPRREFLYADDMADACVFVMEMMDAADAGETLNIGAGEDISIGELAGIVAEIVGFDGRIVFDTEKPDGTPRKLLDVGRLHRAGWRAATGLREGIRRALEDYLGHVDGESHGARRQLPVSAALPSLSG